ncbi:hypothetical protein E4K67_22350 [Desulfosporosinus fructosivorans]|uniref:Uncharacterized protein n=1 Tax=Desulfosporosinus fructosivorans TaxID=2018669 RepID=A0A4Z0QYK4_9FIRM|nr:hypothetical protein [Desulfosporosinus fructosivorans]TGE35862.1 hypothetical protein E4K67_22350 [Desulfosporosinus fructosivorans]
MGFFPIGGGSSGSRNGIITIAPYNCLRKSEARYVLPGTDDQVELNNIIEELCGNPNAQWNQRLVPKVLMLDGDINVSEPVMLKNMLYLEGSGYNTRFILQSGSNKDVMRSENYDLYGHPDDVLYCPILKHFQINGNYSQNQGEEHYGIRIKPQEYLMYQVIVDNCYGGMRLDGVGNYGGYLRDCFIKNNHHIGAVLGGDTTMIGCSIGGNAEFEDVKYNWDACGILLNAFNIQLFDNHFAYNTVDIVANFVGGLMFSNNMFEGGIGENIIFGGTAWGCTIANNRFGGRPGATNDGHRDSIAFRGMRKEPLSGGYGNIIANNNFTINPNAGDVGYGYCISECENCDDNMISNNLFLNGYSQPTPIKIVGENTQATNNMLSRVAPIGFDEPVFTNLITYSEQLDNLVYWSNIDITVTKNAVLSPDGKKTADRLVSSIPYQAIRQTVKVLPNTEYTFSFYVRDNGSSAAKYSVHDLSNGVDIIPPTSYRHKLRLDGFVRIYETFTTPEGCTKLYIFPVRDAGDLIDLFMWGVQLNQGSTASDYKMTTPIEELVSDPTGVLDYPANNNLLLSSENFNNAEVWFSSDVVVTPNIALGLNGTMTADQLTSPSAYQAFRQVITVLAETDYTFSFYALSNSSAEAKYSVYDNTNGADIIGATSYLSQLNESTLTRIGVPFTTPAGCTSIGLYIVRDLGVSGLDLTVWGAMLNVGLTAMPYQTT